MQRRALGVLPEPRSQDQVHCDHGTDQDTNHKGQQCARQPEPGCKHCHQLRIAEANAFPAPDQPIKPVNENNRPARNHDGESQIQKLKENRRVESSSHHQRFSSYEGHEDSSNDAWDGDTVGQPQMFAIDAGIGQCLVELANRLPDDGCPEEANGEFHRRVAPSDRCATAAAAATQGEPACHRHVLPPR
jgi:hypothetical protein